MSTLSAEARELAGRAGDYINQHGWHQSEYENEHGSVCLLGAVYRVSFRDEPRRELKSHLHSALKDWTSGWNDDPGRTQADVVGVLYAVEEGWL
jgi:hypothetical protein